MQRLENKAKHIIDIAAEIANHPANIQEAAYLHIVLCQLGLPRSASKDSSFTRVSDGASITVSFSEDEKDYYSVPYGITPRLILLLACSQATLKNS